MRAISGRKTYGATLEFLGNYGTSSGPQQNIGNGTAQPSAVLRYPQVFAMAFQCLFYPLRHVICCMAKAYLTVMPEDTDLVWDEALFNELTTTFLQPAVQPLLASSYPSRDEAALVEGQLAKILVNAYGRIVRQRRDARVQQLNALL